MKSSTIRTLFVFLAFSFILGCVTPRSEVEVYHLRDMIREGRDEYLSALISGLGARDEAVRAASMRALGDLGEIAVPVLKETVKEGSRRSGPAMLALGFGGSADSLDFIRNHQNAPVVGPPAQEAEREIERRLYARVTQGQLDAMEAYLEAFPESPRISDVRRLRRAQMARSSFARVRAEPTVADLQEYIRLYEDTDDADTARVMLARLLIREAREQIDQHRFQEAREKLERVESFDKRRGPEGRRLIAQSYLVEGKTLRADGDEAAALAALQRATEFPEVRLESERLAADILMAQARRSFEAEDYVVGVYKVNEAQRLDSARRKEVAGLKAELSMRFQMQLDSDEREQRRRALIGLIALGDYASRAMTVYLGSLFASKDYSAVEEVVVALSEAKRSLPEDAEVPGLKQVGELLTNYLVNAVATSEGALKQLFNSSDFRRYWNRHFSPVDARQYPLLYRVEEITIKHMGLSRVGLAMRALLGESAVEVVTGTLLTEDQVLEQLMAGHVGDDGTMAIMTRAQLCARFSKKLAELRRLIDANPARFMRYAINLKLPPLTSADWWIVADEFSETVTRVQSEAKTAAFAAPGELTTGESSLVGQPDFDAKTLTLRVYQPIIAQLNSSDAAVQEEVRRRTLALLLNTARIAFGLYSSIDRYSVFIGGSEISQSYGSGVKEERFDPKTRMMMVRKTFIGIDWVSLRNLNGEYTTRELALSDLNWAIWD